MSAKCILGRIGRRNRQLPLYSRYAPYLLLVAMVLIFFQQMAFTDLILARGDTLLYFYPYWQAASDAIHAGRIPLWNPDLFMGAPFLANSQAGVFYPLNWPFWWFLTVPSAVKATILLHLVIAGSGTYAAARRGMGLSRLASLFSAILFGLGGYLTSQVEHVNQLQGLAWMPWFIAVLAGLGREGSPGPSKRKAALAIGLLFALQLTAGHVQTSFISLCGLLIWSMARIIHIRVGGPGAGGTARSAIDLPFLRQAIIAVPLGLLLALALAAVQLLPTLELSQLSSRQGGLPTNEVLSFSLPLLLLGQAILPGYDQAPFTEYTTFLPVIALVLAVIGGWQWKRSRGSLPASALVIVGLLLAVGVSNPVYWLLAKLPGFNLFRAPARWLVLYSLGISLLAGLGWQTAWERWRCKSSTKGANTIPAPDTAARLCLPLRVGTVFVLALLAWSLIAVRLAPYLPDVPESPAGPLSRLAVLGALVELLFLYLVLSGHRVRSLFKNRTWISTTVERWANPYLLVASALIVLYLSSRALPYNRLTTPEAYDDVRPAVARLQSASVCPAAPENCVLPAGRILSFSEISFDPGDQIEIDAVYGDQLSAEAQYDYTIAVKQKEIVAPNLSLIFGLPTVDGFDGGILPLRSYSDAMGLILPSGVETTDGRLREHLSRVPAPIWLDLFNARFLITDKVSDSWRDGVFFDLQHPVAVNAGESISAGYLPSFEATELLTVATAPFDQVRIVTESGRQWDQLPVSSDDDGVYRVLFPEPASAVAVEIGLAEEAAVESATIKGLTLVDGRDGSFRSIVLGNYRLIHSGDVKIYENLDVFPRAVMVHNWRYVGDEASAIEVMTSSAYRPKSSAVILGRGNDHLDDGSNGRGSTASVVWYDPEEVRIQTESDTGGLLKLTDAYYPGWNAKVDGAPAKILQVDTLFRGVFLSAGRHEVVFKFEPLSYRIGLGITLFGILLIVTISSIYLVSGSKR